MGSTEGHYSSDPWRTALVRSAAARRSLPTTRPSGGLDGHQRHQQAECQRRDPTEPAVLRHGRVGRRPGALRVLPADDGRAGRREVHCRCRLPGHDVLQGGLGPGSLGPQPRAGYLTRRHDDVRERLHGLAPGRHVEGRSRHPERTHRLATVDRDGHHTGARRGEGQPGRHVRPARQSSQDRVRQGPGSGPPRDWDWGRHSQQDGCPRHDSVQRRPSGGSHILWSTVTAKYYILCLEATAIRTRRN